VGRILVPGLALLIVCCLCSVTFSLIRAGSRNAPATVVPSPIVATSDGTQPTPTPLFNFDFPTFTPFPTLPFATALPTLTPPPTTSPLPTQTEPPATETPLPTMTSPPPTATAIPTNPPPTATSAGSVQIITLDKREEYAEIQNFSNTTVELNGWRLVSEAGNQSCRLRGMLQPNEILRIWADRGNPGFDCRFRDTIWRDNAADPAVLYNAQGQEVSRFP
jgi:hypothetical protein